MHERGRLFLNQSPRIKYSKIVEKCSHTLKLTLRFSLRKRKMQHNDTKNTKESKTNPNLITGCDREHILTKPQKELVQFNPPQAAKAIFIKDLNHTLQGDYVLIGKLVSRSEKRKWKNIKASGELLEIYMVDENGDIIKGVLFNDTLEKYDKFIKPGNTYSFTGWRVKTCNPQYSNDKYELTFDNRTVISDVPYDLLHRGINITMVKLNALSSYEPNMRISTVGVIIEVEASKQIMTSKNLRTIKRDILIADDTMTKIGCTLWGDRARDDITSYLGKSVLVKDAEISDYNNSRSLNLKFSSLTLFDPSVPEALDLEKWYQENKDNYLEFSWVKTLKQSILEDSTE